MGSWGGGQQCSAAQLAAGSGPHANHSPPDSLGCALFRHHVQCVRARLAKHVFPCVQQRIGCASARAEGKRGRTRGTLWRACTSATPPVPAGIFRDLTEWDPGPTWQGAISLQNEGLVLLGVRQALLMQLDLLGGPAVALQGGPAGRWQGRQGCGRRFQFCTSELSTADAPPAQWPRARCEAAPPCAATLPRPQVKRPPAAACRQSGPARTSRRVRIHLHARGAAPGQWGLRAGWRRRKRRRQW